MTKVSQHQTNNRLLQILSILLPIATHILSILIYYVPLRKRHPHYEAVLDELHILSSDQKDVTGENSMQQVFLNDYWGRPMSRLDSHKSWRPVSILTFRWLKQNLGYEKVATWIPSLFGKVLPMHNEIFIARYED